MKPRNAGRGIHRAFSLLELLVVLALICVFIAMGMGPRAAHIRKVQSQHCQENLQKLYISLQLYAGDFNGKTPVITNGTTSEAALSLLVPRYTADTSIFICPASQDAEIPPGTDLKKARISYAYYMGRELGSATDALMSDRQIDTASKMKGDEIFSVDGHSPGNNHAKYGGCVLFADGHTEFSEPDATYSLTYTNPVILLNPKP